MIIDPRTEAFIIQLYNKDLVEPLRDYIEALITHGKNKEIGVQYRFFKRIMENIETDYQLIRKGNTDDNR